MRGKGFLKTTEHISLMALSIIQNLAFMAVAVALKKPCLVAGAWALDMCPNNFVKFSKE